MWIAVRRKNNLREGQEAGILDFRWSQKAPKLCAV